MKFLGISVLVHSIDLLVLLYLYQNQVALRPVEHSIQRLQ